MLLQCESDGSLWHIVLHLLPHIFINENTLFAGFVYTGTSDCFLICGAFASYGDGT